MATRQPSGERFRRGTTNPLTRGCDQRDSIFPSKIHEAGIINGTQWKAFTCRSSCTPFIPAIVAPHPLPFHLEEFKTSRVARNGHSLPRSVNKACRIFLFAAAASASCFDELKELQQKERIQAR
jgi:hypothetical protein